MLPSQVPMRITYTRESGIKETFLRKEELGRGGFAIVYKVTNEKTNIDYAMKVISKQRYEGPKGPKSLEKLKNEIQIQKSLNHPNIVRSYCSFSDAFNYYIVLEYCPGKTVQDLLRSSDKGYLSEGETRKILQDVIRALCYLHKRHIIHRDIKLENFMIASDGRIKIADFGISAILKNDDEKRFSICGTPNYLSPEVLQKVNKGHSYEVDIWSIGVAAFTMLTGHPPFDGGRKSITYENIKNCEYRFPPTISISSLAKDFIRTILRIDPDRRPTAIDLSNHGFLTTFTRELIPSFLPKTATSEQTLNTKLDFNTNIPGPVRPRIPLPPRDLNILSPIKDVVVTRPPPIPSTSTSQSKKIFNIPNNFISKVYLHGNDLSYLLADGTVGICFADGSLMVMDPHESFIQFYKSSNSISKVIDLNEYSEKYTDTDEDILHRSRKDKFGTKIALMKRISKTLKSVKSSYELPYGTYDSSIPLHHVKSFLNKNNTILFKFNDRNIQVNFNDHKKLFFFTNTKQMALVRTIKEKCSLMSVNEVIKMNSSNDERKRYMVAKEMLDELRRNSNF